MRRSRSTTSKLDMVVRNEDGRPARRDGHSRRRLRRSDSLSLSDLSAMPPSRSLPILLPTGFKLVSFTHIALLWSSYGHIYRLTLSTEPKSLILKSIHPPALDHPSESHLRKLLSYDVERWFYLNMSARLPSHVKTARSYPLPEDQAHNLLLEDLSGEFPHSASGSLDRAATTCVLDWLAGFHGTYFRVHQHGKKALPTVPPQNACAEAAVSGVWERGTYYYLETRREELEETDQEVYFWLFPWIEKVGRLLFVVL